MRTIVATSPAVITLITVRDIFRIVCLFLNDLFAYVMLYSFSFSIFTPAETPDRDPAKAVKYLQKSCASNHAPSCFNLAVLYRKGDINVQPDQKLFEEYKRLTERLVAQYGGLSGKKTA